MKLKLYKPTTPSLRNLIQLNKTNLKKPLLKSKIKGLKQSFGRNFDGKITVHSKGGGHKKNIDLLTLIELKTQAA